MSEPKSRNAVEKSSNFFNFADFSKKDELKSSDYDNLKCEPTLEKIFCNNAHRSCIVDIPVVHTNLKAEQFLSRGTKRLITVPLPYTDNCNADSVRKNLSASFSACSWNSEESSIDEFRLKSKYGRMYLAEENKHKFCANLAGLEIFNSLKTKESKLDNSNSLEILKKKAELYLAGEEITFELEDRTIWTVKKSLKNKTCKRMQKEMESRQEENNRWNTIKLQHDEYYLWIDEGTKTSYIWLNEARSKSPPSASGAENQNSSANLDVIASLMGVTRLQLETMDIIDETIFSFSRILLGDANWPDLCKILAFSAWQKGEASKCAYFLSESHGCFIKTEICDKHNLYLCRVREMPYMFKFSDEEIQKRRIYQKQNSDLLRFGTSFRSFQEQISSINSKWNIVQITSDFHSLNRFGCDLVGLKVTPGIWLTCFMTMRTGKMGSCVIYIGRPQPLEHFEEDFIHLMLDNKSISDGFTGDRKRYWEIRAEHNNRLMQILAKLEDWLFPYTFLLPGSIKSESTQSRMWDFVDRVQDMLGKVLDDSTSILLYKLAENYTCVSTKCVSKFVESLEHPLNVSHEVTSNILQLLKNFANSFLNPLAFIVQERHETILILDSELEQYPWDWLPIFKRTKTGVTRMFSWWHIYSSLRITKKFIHDYPNFVDPNSGLFILNPDTSLESVQKRLEEYLSARNWDGISGRSPTHEEFESGLQNHDIMVYCGHGTGCSIYPDWALSKLLCRSVPILMGCSSAQTKFSAPKTFVSSVINTYSVAACPCVVGFLWEVTDVECDRVTIDLLERWLPNPHGFSKLPVIGNFDIRTPRQQEKNLVTAVMKSRCAATQFMTEAAIVVYGLPVFTLEKQQNSSDLSRSSLK